MTDPFVIRRGTLSDVDIIAYHRYAMFRDMGTIDPALAKDLQTRTVAWLRDAMPRGEYISWLAAPAGEPAHIVAGAGAQLRRTLPRAQRPGEGRPGVVDGKQAIVVNVFTESDYRRRGAGRLLMLEVMAWAKAERLDSLVLHAAPDGRALYESLGFVPTNEMRYAGDLSHWDPPSPR